MSGHPEDIHRQGYRFRAGVPAELHREGKIFACEAQNISRGGALLVGEFPAPSAETVDFVLKAATGTLTVRLTGRVIRCQPNAEGEGLCIALEYVDMDEARRGAVEALLARVLEAPNLGPFDGLKPGAPALEIKNALEAIPLHERIALAARTGLIKDREYLRLDTHPAVLEALAHNSGLGLVEARALAASTFLMSGTLDALASNPRFNADEELLMAVAVHPRVSPATADRVTAKFKVPQLKKLLARPGLNQLLREKLFRRTTQK